MQKWNLEDEEWKKRFKNISEYLYQLRENLTNINQENCIVYLDI